MALVTLAAFSAAAGVAILLAFKAATNRHALQATRRKLRAHLLAIRLFADNPGLIVRSQGRLLLGTARYFVLLLPAFLLAGVPLFLAWDSLDAIWGRAPFAPGETVMVTAQLRVPGADVRLETPGWLELTSPAVHSAGGHEVSWRLRVMEAGSGDVVAVAGAERTAMRIEARPGLHYLRDRVSAGAGPIERLEAPYPSTGIGVLGVVAAWPVWFAVFSTATALALRHRLHVSF